MVFGFLLPLRIAQSVFAIIVMGLSGYVCHWYSADTLTAPPSQVNFLLFATAFSVISLLYFELTPRFASKLSHPYANLALELLNTLFYFAGFISLSVFLSKLLFCRGNVCAAARADAVFAAFSFMLWMGSSTILALEFFKGGFSLKKKNQDVATEKAIEAGVGQQ